MEIILNIFLCFSMKHIYCFLFYLVVTLFGSFLHPLVHGVHAVIDMVSIKINCVHIVYYHKVKHVNVKRAEDVVITHTDR